MYKCVEGFAMAARTVPTSERLVLSLEPIFLSPKSTRIKYFYSLANKMKQKTTKFDLQTVLRCPCDRTVVLYLYLYFKIVLSKTVFSNLVSQFLNLVSQFSNLVSQKLVSQKLVSHCTLWSRLFDFGARLPTTSSNFLRYGCSFQ